MPAHLLSLSDTSIQILAKISHPFIVGFHGAMQDTDHIYYLLEFCHGGDLGSLLCKYGSLNWATSQFFVAEILLAIHFLHLRQVRGREGSVVILCCLSGAPYLPLQAKTRFMV